MKALENRTMDSKVEMDILDALDEIKSLNAQHAKIDPLAVLEQRMRAQQDANKLTEEEEQQIEEAFNAANEFVRRLDDEEEPDLAATLVKSSPLLQPPKKKEKPESLVPLPKPKKCK